MENVTWVEVVWTLAGLVGTVNMLWLMAGLLAERRRRLRAGLNGMDRLIELERLGVKGALLGIVAIILATGVLALLTPPANPARPVSVFGTLVLIGLLAIAILAVGAGIWMRICRMGLRDYWLERLASAGQDQHAETMAALRHNTAITAAAQDAAATAAAEAGEAKTEATAAHVKAQTVIERIDEATRRHDDDKGC